ncbi:MAG: hypothetical protein Q9180_006070, partial [Flavoplaca navasiana]
VEDAYMIRYSPKGRRQHEGVASWSLPIGARAYAMGRAKLKAKPSSNDERKQALFVYALRVSSRMIARGSFQIKTPGVEICNLPSNRKNLQDRRSTPDSPSDTDTARRTGVSRPSLTLGPWQGEH